MICRLTDFPPSPTFSDSSLLADEHVEALREFADEDANLLGYYPFTSKARHVV